MIKQDIDRDAIRFRVKAFIDAVPLSEDLRNAEVSRRYANLTAVFRSWQTDGARLPAAEPVLQAASNLQAALYSLNPEKLPLEYRTSSDELTSVLLRAEQEGFRVSENDEPMPEDDGLSLTP